MEKSKVDMFVSMHVEHFLPEDLAKIRFVLEQLDDDKYYYIQGIEYQKPSMIIFIAVLLGWERFWLNDIFLGILKILTLGGCFVWWFIDIFTANNRTKKHNFRKFKQVVNSIQSY
jgi:hypothetical protein